MIRFYYFLVMNAEKAAYFSPVFSQKRQRTLEALLRGLHTDHLELREVNIITLPLKIVKSGNMLPLERPRSLKTTSVPLAILDCPHLQLDFRIHLN